MADTAGGGWGDDAQRLIKVRAHDVEEVRLRAEHEFAARLQGHPVFARLRAELTPPEPEAVRRRLVGRSLRLGETMAPHVYRAANEARDALSVERSLEIYQSSGPENAAIHCVDAPVLLEVQGRIITLLDRGTALAVFGHELGHWKCHGTGNPLREVSALASMLAQARDVPDDLADLASRMCMAREFTADRYGLLACQDLSAALRLEMVLTTGLHGDDLVWDTEAYLAQARELMDALFEKGGRVMGSTHPEHSVRAWAAWLFSESDVFRRLTGLGSGSRPIAEVDALIARALGDPELDASYSPLEAAPPEVDAAALAACVIVATSDDDLADGEVEAIEKVFADRVPDWRAYLAREVALERFAATVPLLRRYGADAHRNLFLLLVHVVLADGVIHPHEVGTLLGLGEILGCRAVWERAFDAIIRRLVGDPVDAAPVDLPTVPDAREAAGALDTFLQGIAERGGGSVTLRRLLRILGEGERSTEAMQVVARAFRRAGLTADEDLDVVALDAPVRVSVAQVRAPTSPSRAPALRASLADAEARRATLGRALSRLRDTLVSGDGRSPSVRVRRAVSGRVFDLDALESVSVGRSERALAQVRAGRATRLVEPSESGTHDGARKAAAELLALDREHRSRVEETGARDLALGYPVLAGSVGGWAVRAPLVLYPVEIEREARGARGFAVTPQRERPPVVNHALLRAIFHRRSFAYGEALATELDALAADPAQGPEAVIAALARVGIAAVTLTGQLQPLRERGEEMDAWRDDRMEIEECALLGLFPQSESDLLHDYDELLAEVAKPGADVAALLGCAGVLLTEDLREAFGVDVAARPEVAGQPLVPVTHADPSQRDVLLDARGARALVVDGPPGTGKSQVIVNLVADALARGERVAVVCEKRAALDVVVQRLDALGLRRALALVHDVTGDRKALYQQVAARLDAAAEDRHDPAEARRVADERDRVHRGLTQRAEALRLRLGDDEPCLAELHCLAANVDAPALPPQPGLLRVPPAAVARVLDALAAMQPCADVFAQGSPWLAPPGAPPRPSLAAWEPAHVASFGAALAAAEAAAARVESLRAQVGLDAGAIAAARPALLAARAALALTAQGGVTAALFPRLLAVASGDPRPLSMLAQAEAAWAQSQAALAAVATRVEFSVPPEVEALLPALRAESLSPWRFFKPSWWNARSVVRGAVAQAWPEKAGAPLDLALLDAAQTRAAAARAWRVIDAAIDAAGLWAFAGSDASSVGALLRSANTLVAVVMPLAAQRPALASVGAWPAGESPDAMHRWAAAVDARLGLLDAVEALQRAAAPAATWFPWTPSLPTSAALSGLRRAWADAPRAIEADRRLDRARDVIADAPAIVSALHAALPDASPSRWRDAALRAWVDARIEALTRGAPAVVSLDAPTPYGDDLSAGERLSALHREAGAHEVARLSGRLDGAALARVAPAEKGRRRTAEQAAREAMLKECGKQRNVMPLRAFARRFASQGLLDLLPVWLLSPETMAVVFPREPLFDLVIFDEASQCTVENGLPVLMRARRAVIAGDERQMPPTSFFSTRRGDGDDEAAPEDARATRELFDAESLLSLGRARVARRGLEWHYRCLYEELIAFSNHAMYQGGLMTVPAVTSRTARPAVRWVDVPDGRYESGRNAVEAARVVDLLDEYLREPGAPTLGVVTFNLAQRATVLDEIDRRREADAGFAQRWDAACQRERLDARPFVKNLENAQGDERDVILFSLGHSPQDRVAKDGSLERRVPARFGPLGQRGGERRLNVAVSRARRECVVVASFEPSMLSVARSTNEGPRLFKAFLEFVWHLSGGRRAQAERVLDSVREGAAPSDGRRRAPRLDAWVPLAAQIALALQDSGVACELGVGTSGFKVDLAVVDPADPSRFSLGVLCDDGAGTADAFERLAHRPDALRARGWKLTLVTAREWHLRRDEVLRRVLDASRPAPAPPAAPPRRPPPPPRSTATA